MCKYLLIDGCVLSGTISQHAPATSCATSSTVVLYVFVFLLHCSLMNGHCFLLLSVCCESLFKTCVTCRNLSRGISTWRGITMTSTLACAATFSTSFSSLIDIYGLSQRSLKAKIDFMNRVRRSWYRSRSGYLTLQHYYKKQESCLNDVKYQ